MKKFLFVLMGVFAVAGAFAAGENVPTSKGYVDSKLGEKQDTISANDGASRVLTNTGTAGEYGTKGIYDANGEYAVQTQNLVDAATMNAGVQNAIDSEFQCIEYDDHGECLLYNLSGVVGNNCIKGFSEYGFKYTYASMIPNIDNNFLDNYTVESARTLTYENGMAVCAWPNDITSPRNNGYVGRASILFKTGHKYASIAYANVTRGANYNIGLTGSTANITGGESEVHLVGTGEWEWAIMPMTCNTGGISTLNYRIQARNATMRIKQMYLIDLTAIFGAGNEPISAQEISERCLSPCYNTYIPQNQQ